MNELQIFSKDGFGEVRSIIYNDKPYFVGNDIASALDYSRPYESVSTHCKGAVSYRVLTNGGLQETKIVPLGDVCRLIVKAASQSKNPDIKEKAEEFESWIFDEVLPAIIQNGTYSIKANDIPTLTAATGYIRELRRAMEKQGSTPQDVAKMIEMVCRRFNLPLPLNFVKESPFEQLSLTINVAKGI